MLTAFGFCVFGPAAAVAILTIADTIQNGGR